MLFRVPLLIPLLSVYYWCNFILPPTARATRSFGASTHQWTKYRNRPPRESKAMKTNRSCWPACTGLSIRFFTRKLKPQPTRVEAGAYNVGPPAQLYMSNQKLMDSNK